MLDFVKSPIKHNFDTWINGEDLERAYIEKSKNRNHGFHLEFSVSSTLISSKLQFYFVIIVAVLPHFLVSTVVAFNHVQFILFDQKYSSQN